MTSFSQMIFDFETVRWLVMAALGIYAWVIGRQSASAQELLDLRTRVTKLEADLRQVPSQQQLHELVVNVERLAGSVGALSERIEPLRHAINRVENHLLNNK
ncbi:MAG: DUF2730 family protein [Comamonas sp.]